MRTKIIALFLAVVMVLTILPFSVFATEGTDGTISIVADKSTIKPGESVELTVKFDAKTAIGGINIYITVPTGFEYVSHEIVLTTADFMMMNFDKTSAFFGAGVGPGKTGVFDALKVVYKAQETCSGECDFGINVEQIGNVIGDSVLDFGSVTPATVTVKAPEVAVSSVFLNKTSLALTVGDAAAELTATIEPGNATNKNLVWSIVDEDGAVEFSSNGDKATVTAKKAGTATVTVKSEADPTKSATCTVTVKAKPVPVESVTVSPEELTLALGSKSEPLTATVTPDTATNKKVTWSSDKTSVATVDESGVVTANGVGTAIITVTTEDGEKTATCTVNVIKPLTGIAFVDEKLELKVNETYQLKVNYTPQDASNKKVSWSTSDYDIVAVEDNGEVLAKAPGKATITVTTEDGGFTDTIEITVVLPAESVEIAPKSVSLVVGGTSQLNATVTPAGTTDKTEWSSSDAAVATVDATGKVTAVGVGTATITAKAGEKSDSCTVTVNEFGISFSGDTVIPAQIKGYSGYPGTTLTLTNTGTTSTGALTVKLSGEHAGSFTVTPGFVVDPGIAQGGISLIEVNANNGLEAGNYSVTVIVTGANDLSAETIVTLHVHEFAKEVKTDAYVKGTRAQLCNEQTTYYYACTVDGCSEKSDADAHTYFGEIGTEHDWATEWTTDENNHWHKCVREGCKTETAVNDKSAHEYKEVAEDAFLTPDGKGNCENPSVYYKSCVCGRKSEATFTVDNGHKWASDTWTQDAGKDTHSRVCTNENCPLENKTKTEACSVEKGTEATCTAKAVCGTCGGSFGEKKEHTPAQVEADKYIAAAGSCVNGTPNTYYQSCSVCSAALTDKPTFEGKVPAHKTTYVQENDKHYEKCTVEGCTYAGEKVACSGGTATCTAKAVCSVCKNAYGTTAVHNYATAWSFNETHHWHVCANGNSACTAVAGYEEHVPGPKATEKAAQVCLVCNYEIAPKLEPTFDENMLMLLLMMINKKYDVTAEATEGGMITVPGVNKVKFDKNVSFKIVPSDGYVISDVLVDGKSVGAVSEYTFKNVRKNHTIKAVFEKAPWVNPYKDVKEGDWFYDAVKFVSENNLMNGTDAAGKVFDPSVVCNRSMLVTVLWRLEGSPVVSAKVKFSDVKADAWYAAAVNWASANGIVEGNGDNKYAPDQELTYEQAAAILYRYATYKGVIEGTATAKSTKLTCSDWAKDEVIWAEANGLLKGMGTEVKDMTKSIQRAEIASMLKAFCEGILVK